MFRVDNVIPLELLRPQNASCLRRKAAAGVETVEDYVKLHLRRFRQAKDALTPEVIIILLVRSSL